MTLKKPSDIFGKKPENLNIKIVETKNSLHDELVKVENLSDQIIQLQQELSQKVIQSDLEELFSSQISNIKDNFENLQNDFKKLNKRDIKNFNELKDIVSNNINDVKEEVYNIVGLLSNNLEEYSKELLNIRADVVINERHINNVNKYFKEGVFSETEKLTSNNLKNNIVRLEKKIDFIRETYSKIEPEVIIREAINQGLLNEPPDKKNSDPLTPLDQNFVTLDQLQQHYRLFLNRIQQQLSTLGGGGETQLRYLDDVVGVATNPGAYNSKFLQWDSSTNTAKFVNINSVNITDIVTDSYGNFFDTTTQAIVGVNTHQAVRLNTTDLSNQVSIANSSHIVIANSGIYNIQFSLQIDKTDVGSAYIYTWLKKNGLDIPNTATEIAVQGNSSEIVPSRNFLVSSNANDYYELIVSATDTHVQLKAVSANGVVPAIPSAILSVVLVAGSNPLGIGTTNTTNIILTTNEYNVPLWSDNIDGGTF